jgi:hypothetical protein
LQEGRSAWLAGLLHAVHRLKRPFANFNDFLEDPAYTIVCVPLDL